jgi:hypothetical protein
LIFQVTKRPVLDSQQTPRVREKCRTGGGQMNLPRAANKQLSAEFFLQSPDAEREARLREIEPRGRPAEVPIGRHGNERP